VVEEKKEKKLTPNLKNSFQPMKENRRKKIKRGENKRSRSLKGNRG